MDAACSRVNKQSRMLHRLIRKRMYKISTLIQVPVQLLVVSKITSDNFGEVTSHLNFISYILILKKDTSSFTHTNYRQHNVNLC